ncbi:MAG: hypothetical protein CM1200mP40_25540 [Gammaproteobacteria bacterium]|nr:MAG: hypothetical protein CM1200mP40_25540 [Gammaproteobacteria bacterium]
MKSYRRQAKNFSATARCIKRIFGPLQGVPGDFLSNFENSLISAQYTGRSLQLEEIIERAGSTIEQLNVKRWNALVLYASGVNRIWSSSFL